MAGHAQPVPHLLEVWLNGQRVDTFAPLMAEDGRWYAPAVTLTQWRLRPTDAPRHIDGVPHHSLQGWQPLLDTATQRLALDVPGADFLAQRLQIDAAPSAGAPIVEPLPGLALDYAGHLEREGERQRHAALLDLRAFGWSTGGLLRTSGVLRGGTGLPAQAQWQRLDSTWSHADPEGVRRTAVGDAITCGGELAPSLRFAGVQHGTDFALRPDLITQPLPAVQGSAQVPSGVDLLVNGRPAGSASVGPGRYTLDTLPGVTGAGEIRVVQRDVLGAERVQTVPFYVSPRLLRPGLSDTCAEAGVMRRGYASADDRYRGGFVAGGLRRGLRDDVTLLARAEVGQQVRAFHIGAHWVPVQLGVLSAQLATSRTQGLGTGRRALVGFERTGPGGSFSATSEHHDERYRLLDGTAPPRHRSTVFAGTTVGSTTLSAGAVWQTDANDRRSRLFSAGAQRRLGPQWHAGLSVFRRDGRVSVAMLFSRALDPQTSVAVRVQSSAEPGGPAGLSAQAQRNEPAAGGLGWRVQGGNEVLRSLVGVTWLGDAGRLELQAARWRDDPSTHWRVSAQGGVLWFGGAPIAGRPIGDSAAARVELNGLPGVGVQLNHREAAVTDARGHAWVWGLLPWQDNTVGIAADVLPIDVALSVPIIAVRAPARTAVRVRFPAARTRSALLQVKRPDGTWVAPGSRAISHDATAQGNDGSGAPFAHGGQVWLTEVSTYNQLRIEGPQGPCHVAFVMPEGVTQAALGPLTCTPEIRR